MSKIFTQAALQRFNLSELQALYQLEMRDLVRSNEDTHQRRNALANLDTLSRAIAQRRCSGPCF